jgi:hypothetical protein
LCKLAEISFSRIHESQHSHGITVKESMTVRVVSPSGKSLTFDVSIKMKGDKGGDVWESSLQIYIDDLPRNITLSEEEEYGALSDDECDNILLYSSTKLDSLEFVINMNRAHKTLGLQYMSVYDLCKCLFRLIRDYSSGWLHSVVDSSLEEIEEHHLNKHQ